MKDKKLIIKGIEAIKWLTGTNNEFPELKEFADNFIRNANRVAGFQAHEREIKLRFGYEVSTGRTYRLEIIMGDRILYEGYLGCPVENKKGEKLAFQFLREKCILEVFAKGIELTMKQGKIRYT